MLPMAAGLRGTHQAARRGKPEERMLVGPSQAHHPVPEVGAVLASLTHRGTIHKLSVTSADFTCFLGHFVGFSSESVAWCLQHASLWSQTFPMTNNPCRPEDAKAPTKQRGHVHRGAGAASQAPSAAGARLRPGVREPLGGDSVMLPSGHSDFAQARHPPSAEICLPLMEV